MGGRASNVCCQQNIANKLKFIAAQNPERLTEITYCSAGTELNMQQWSSRWSASTVLATLIVHAIFQRQGASGDRGLRRVARLAGAGFTYNYNFGLSATRQPLCTSCGSHPLCKSSIDFRHGKTAFLCAQHRHRCHPARSRIVIVHVGFGWRLGRTPCPDPDTETTAGIIPSKIS